MGRRNKKSKKKAASESLPPSASERKKKEDSEPPKNERQSLPEKKKDDVGEKDRVVVTMEALRAMSDSDDENSVLPPDDELNAEARALKESIEKGMFNNLFQKKGSSNAMVEESSVEEIGSDDENKGHRRSEKEGPKGKALEIADKESEEELSVDEDGRHRDDDGERGVDRGDAEEEEPPRKGTAPKKPAKKKKENRSSKESDSISNPIDSDDDSGRVDNDDSVEPALKLEKKKDKELSNQAEARMHNNEDEDAEGDVKEMEHSDSDEDEDEENIEIEQLNALHRKALHACADEYSKRHVQRTWPETYEIVASQPLPFDKQKGLANEDLLDIHDDLKREVCFYNMALEAALEGRRRCEQAKIPFSRPESFFAEMIKTDEHMAKVKDRLIFENKRIEAVQQRKANKEHKLRAKESRANKLAEKAKRKRDNLQAVEDWAKEAAARRGGGKGGEDYPEPNKRRLAANQKYGRGGDQYKKRGHFKRNDRKSLNDLSDFSPRGGFAGGRKRGAPSGGPQKRPGKRARDASRARRS